MGGVGEEVGGRVGKLDEGNEDGAGADRLGHKVPVAVQRKLLGENARRLYGIEPVMVVTERVEQYEPAKLPW